MCLQHHAGIVGQKIQSVSCLMENEQAVPYLGARGHNLLRMEEKVPDNRFQMRIFIHIFLHHMIVRFIGQIKFFPKRVRKHGIRKFRHGFFRKACPGKHFIPTEAHQDASHIKHDIFHIVHFHSCLLLQYFTILPSKEITDFPSKGKREGIRYFPALQFGSVSRDGLPLLTLLCNCIVFLQ